ncbi:MAG: J domain-containing protein [Candidatus Riflebacteria bacterium]|nr:J domain-containing protein [Candidatus Riflebacteria bacterium]
MNYTDQFVLPFKWREFGRWFENCGKVDSENDKGRLKIAEAGFVAGGRKLRGIRIKGELSVKDSHFCELFLCAFLVDLHRKELFEPFIGNPESFDERMVSPRLITLTPSVTQKYELFIQEQGWILPSIWRFLMQSIGLRHKTSERKPDIIVFAFQEGNSVPVYAASLPFDYFGSAHHLQEELIMNDFFDMLHIEPDASESEIQRAYIASCRKFQELIPDCVSSIVLRRRTSMFSRIKQGYHIWTDRLQKRRNEF